MDKLRFVSFASGSNGNCCYIGNGHHGILIDAGIGPRTIRKRMKECGMDLSQVLAVFVTHDHTDHIKGVGTLGEVYHIPVYSTEAILNGMNRNHRMKEKVKTCRKPIEKNVPVHLAEFTIEAFEVSHDGTDNVGYCITYADKTLVIATDLGYIGESQAEYLKRANVMVIESNYDAEMLSQSNYDNYLQCRISGPTGHLCNDETAEFLYNNYSEKLTHVFLCHLSKNSNTHEIALNTVITKLNQLDNIVAQGKLKVEALPRTTPSEMVRFV